MVLTLLLRESLCFSCADLTLVVQVALVSDQNDGDFLVRVVAHLLQPLADRFERDAARDVVDQKHADGLSVVSVRDRSITLLAGRVPDLRPDQLVLHWHIVRCELNSNRCMRLSFKLVFRVSE